MGVKVTGKPFLNDTILHLYNIGLYFINKHITYLTTNYISKASIFFLCYRRDICQRYKIVVFSYDSYFKEEINVGKKRVL